MRRSRTLAASGVSAVVTILIALATFPVIAGTPLFLPAVPHFSGGYFPVSITVADVNGDGKRDLLIAHFCGDDCTEGAVDVLLGNGDASFQPPVSYDSGGSPAMSVAAADVNGDGKIDIVLASCAPVGSNTCPDPNQNHGVIRVLLGSGDGTFQPVVTYDSGGAGARSVSVADLNGDGDMDLIVANECDSSVACAHGSVGILSGNGNGTFQAAVTFDTKFDINDAVVADVNGDGAPDLVVTSGGNNRVGVLLSTSNGTFQAEVNYGLAGIGPRAAAATDVSGDQIPDLLVANTCNNSSCTSGSVDVLLGNGDGTFGPAVGYDSGGPAAQSVAVSDVNGDDRADVLVANSQANNAGVLLGNGNGTFQAAVTYDSGGNFAWALAVADVNGDTAPDLLVTNVCDSSLNCSSGIVSVLLNNTAPTTVRIDIRPGEEQNTLNPASHGLVSTAVLGTGILDVATIDPGTVRFGPFGAQAVRVYTRDVNRDAHLDLVFQFEMDDTGIACGDTSATLVGATYDGVTFRGTDAITTVGCGVR